VKVVRLSALGNGRLLGAVGRNQLIGLKVFHPRFVHTIARMITYSVKTQSIILSNITGHMFWQITAHENKIRERKKKKIFTAAWEV
jgi:hypothetical protein